VARLIVSPAARADLLRIFDWISQRSGEDRAEAVMRRLMTSFTRLASFPRMGTVVKDVDGLDRRYGVRPWIVFYRPLIDGGVEILRVFDSHRDIAALLGKKS
jgi:toxin ParE1/3/4